MHIVNGLFGWADLMTRDTATAGHFYEGVFGWTHVDVPVAEGVTHTHFYAEDRLVAGMSHMMPGLPESAPAVWNSYVIVDDIDATLSAVEGAGGTVVRSAWHLLDGGRMAMIEDPTGALLGILQPHGMNGADVFNVPGAMTWNELQTRDLDAVTGFYEQVFGWVWAPGPSPGYRVANLPAKQASDKSNAGAMTMPPGVPAGAPNAWYVYFTVADCDKTIALTEQFEGSVFLPTMDAGPGRFAGLTDPTGAMFFVMQFE